MALVFVDTSAWWAYFDRSDQSHALAVRTYGELAGERADLITTDHVLDEVITGLGGRAGRRIAILAGQGILQSPTVQVVFSDMALLGVAWDLYRRHGRIGLSFTDCTSVVTMRRRGIPVAFSFDADFRKMGLDVVPS